MSFRHNPFADRFNPVSSVHHGFSSPSHSRSDSSGSVNSVEEEKRQFRSYRLVGQYQQPWIGDKRINRTRYNNYIVYALGFLGLCGAVAVCYFTYANVPKHNYCLVLDEKFTTIDPNIWNHEVQIDGFGAGSFDWTTTDPANSFVASDGLHIVPTLTNESTSITTEQISNGYTLNLTSDGSCTSTLGSSCAIRSNNTKGYTIPPVRSARLNTKGKATIKYGRVEVVAKLPKGDWLWPAIWMMPQDSAYGPWPASGEIDIVESRGNDYNYPYGGLDTVTSTLHWAPATALDSYSYWRTINGFFFRRTDFSKDFHTFGLEWSRNYLFTYIDSRLHQVLYVDFSGSKTLWDKGGFAETTINNTNIQNPWAGTGNTNTPFDQSFYLVLNVAVGSSNGWFKDNVANKPWVDQSAYLAPGSFWQAVNKWLPTWGAGNDRGMTVKSVKMWQEGACH